MDSSKVDIFIENKNGKTYLIESPKSISLSNFKDLLINKKISIGRDFFMIFRGKKYDKSNMNMIFSFEDGDKIELGDYREEEALYVKMNPNVEINDGNMKKGKVTGILRLILLKYISSFINDVKSINSLELRNIISELKIGIQSKENPEDDIKSNLMEKNGNNILSYSSYVDEVVKDQDIDYLLNLVGPNIKNEIDKYWSILSKYEEFNKLFQIELFNSIKNSYFDYSLVNLSLYEQKNRIRYLQAKSNCPGLVTRYLFHGTQIDPISKIITNGFLYTRKPFYGMGIYFSDMLDYVSFYSGGTNYNTRRILFGKILPVQSTFSCVSAEVFYNVREKNEIYDFSKHVNELNHFPSYEELQKNYKDKMIPMNGVNFARVEPNQGQVRNKEDIINDKRKGRFIGTEYVITEMDQILPLYGLTFKRNEYFVLWRDPNFEGQNDFSDYLKERQLFIYQIAKMNAYFESSTERALEIIQKKKFNKIILISSIGLDLSGKKFVEIAREILGFNVVVLFFSRNQNHFSWLQNFPNALYTNNAGFYRDYILNYNEKGLLKLKENIENVYNIKLKFTNDFMKFPKFIEQEKYDDIIFEEPNPNFKIVLIKNSENNCILCINENKIPCFISASDIDIKYYNWSITMIGNEITLFSNGFYLGADLQNGRPTAEQFMKRYNFERIGSDEYIIYFENKNNILTVNGNYANIQKGNYKSTNQRFKFIEYSI